MELDINKYIEWIRKNGVASSHPGYANDLKDIRNGLLKNISQISSSSAKSAFSDEQIRNEILNIGLEIDIFNICTKDLVNKLNLYVTTFLTDRSRIPSFIVNGQTNYNLINGYSKKIEGTGNSGQPAATINKYIDFLQSGEGKEYIRENCKEIEDDDDVVQILPEKQNDIEKYCDLLQKCKPQIILQGAPGTGKTYTAAKIAEKLTENNMGEYKIIQFHPAYSYEDFVRGIIAKPLNNGIIYEVVDKILLEFVEKAMNNKNKKFVLILDEINRANLPAVLGELIFALEYRDIFVDCLYKKGNDNKIKLPENLFIIGTMNTADRSVGSIDYAIRRRFAFVTLKTDKNIIKNLFSETNNQALALYEKVEKLFTNIAPDFNKDDIMIGHSYFLANTINKLELKLEYEIKPILREYVKDGVLNDRNGIRLIDEINNLKL